MEEGYAASTAIEQWGTLAIAVYGVIQVWLIAIWRRFSAGRITIFKTGHIEIGFSNFGPTIGLNGTLRAKHKDAFVSDISLVVKKQSDGATHSFEWAAFRSPQISNVGGSSVSLELPSGFNVLPSQPYRYNIFFSDRATQDTLSPALIAVRKEWQDLLISRRDQIVAQAQEENSDTDSILSLLYDNEFCDQSEAYRNAWDLLTRANYWSSGEYELAMAVKTASPDRKYDEQFCFSISDVEFEELRLNAVATLREACLNVSNYRFAYAQYQ